MSADGDRAAALWEANAEAWTQLVRGGHDVYRDALNTPAFLAMLPPVSGLDGLDIGCGEGANTRALARLGARMQAIDVAPTFVGHAVAAEHAEPLGIVYQTADAMALPFADGRFDFATAFMSLMDVRDFRAALAEARRVLKPGGFLQFSILHPCFATPHRRVLRDASGEPYAIEVGGYFHADGGRTVRWMFSNAPAGVKARIGQFELMEYHHPLSAWINTLIAVGFTIEQLGEPMADDATAQRVPPVSDTQIAPLFLHVRARSLTEAGDDSFRS